LFSIFNSMSVQVEHEAPPHLVPGSVFHRVWPTAMRSDVGVLVLVALVSLFVRTLINGQYGFHRDELLTYTNALHLDWGYVPYPPMTPFLARLELELFGTSL